MEWFEIEKASFFGAVWLLAFLVSLFRSLGDDHSQSWTVSVGSSGVTGFIAFSVVCLFLGNTTDRVSGHFYYLGLATLIGLLGRYQEIILKRLAKKHGLQIDDGDVDEKNND